MESKSTCHMTNEKRLIDVEGFKNAFHTSTKPEDIEICFYKGRVFVAFGAVTRAINDAPTVDAVEVVHGRWVYDSGSGRYFCSACDEYALSFKKDTLYDGDLYEVCLTDYCPNCGAKMDGDGNG